MTSRDWLTTAADESRHHEWALGGVLRKYADIEALTDTGLANELGCSLDTIRRLCLCRRPTQDRLEADIAVICERFGIDPGRIVALIRRVQAVEALGSGAGADEEHDAMLLAARDRDDPKDQE